MCDFLKDKEELAVSIGNKAQLGMFYVRLGTAMIFRLQLVDGIRYLRQALTIGEEIGDQKVIGYACAYLAFGCADHGLIDEGIGFGNVFGKWKYIQKIWNYIGGRPADCHLPMHGKEKH